MLLKDFGSVFLNGSLIYFSASLHMSWLILIFKDGRRCRGEGMGKEEEHRWEIALSLCRVIIVHTEELEKAGQPAPEYG